ncbi:amino acid ABC transporter substrate-binding protein [Bosea sp. 685]|uniref:amino acid ABC transporter substrate-binding protein n=1 Tax=Bosea sp. 685 TaxID=3080057 RepID=UPI002892E989|nr:amino acid ABC transporter substrate-binding protein [Bosea sp. 685]WNJ87902.1 amino acid ABC transporter substrate-binding protein [Bosea sp. 685]
MKRHHSIWGASSLVLGVFAAGFATAGPTVDKIKARGAIICGVSQGIAGFSIPDSSGKWSGMDVDLCRGLAAAVFDDPNKVQYSPLSAKDRFTALQSSAVDLLARNTTWTMQREASLGMNFAVVNFYDGNSFMTKKSLNVKNAKDLGGASICVTAGTTMELNVADFFRANQMKFEPVVFVTADETAKAYETGRCDVLIADSSANYSRRAQLQKPDDHIVLPELISKEPLGPAVRQGDDQWLNIVKWTHYAMINAEELGVTKANVVEMRSSTNPEIRRLLGLEGNLGEGLGLSKDWADRIVRAVGNYGEVYDRNVGQGSVIKIERTTNALWTKGGLQYAPPVR